MQDPLAKSLQLDEQGRMMGMGSSSATADDPMTPALDLERPLLGESDGGNNTVVTTKPRPNRGRLMFDMIFAALFGVFGFTVLVSSHLYQCAVVGVPPACVMMTDSG